MMMTMMATTTMATIVMMAMSDDDVGHEDADGDVDDDESSQCFMDPCFCLDSQC